MKKKKTAWNKGLPKGLQPFFGRKHSKLFRIKMKENKNNLGRKLSEEWKEKISKSLIGNNRAKGKFSDIKRIAKLNSEFICQCRLGCPWHKTKCNFSFIEALEVDHIKPKSKFPELKNEIKNLQILCSNCHRRKSNREKHKHPGISYKFIHN